MFNASDASFAKIHVLSPIVLGAAQNHYKTSSKIITYIQQTKPNPITRTPYCKCTCSPPRVDTCISGGPDFYKSQLQEHFNFARNHLPEICIRTNNCRGTHLRCYSRVPMVSDTPSDRIPKSEKWKTQGLAFVGNNYKSYMYLLAETRPGIQYQKRLRHTLSLASNKFSQKTQTRGKELKDQDLHTCICMWCTFPYSTSSALAYNIKACRPLVAI